MVRAWERCIQQLSGRFTRCLGLACRARYSGGLGRWKRKAHWFQALPRDNNSEAPTVCREWRKRIRQRAGEGSNVPTWDKFDSSRRESAILRVEGEVHDSCSQGGQRSTILLPPDSPILANQPDFHFCASLNRRCCVCNVTQQGHLD